MDLQTQIRLTRELVDLDSTTGREGDACRYAAAALRDLGYTVTEQSVTEDRFNVIAVAGAAPEVVFSTHLDCVPPFFPSREEQGRIYGRGACDAKGVAVAQIAAAERLRRAGEERVGLLFVVGEERGSDGARRANTVAPPACRFLVNGEPTDNRLGRATRGLYRARLHTRGRAAHSSLPELGDSAIEKMVDAVAALRDVSWPSDGVLGTTFYTVGMIQGGVAPNVVPPSAMAEVLFRTVGAHVDVKRALQAAMTGRADVEDVFVVPMVPLTVVPGFETAVFPFTTDIAFLGAWGAPLLCGPGSITVAHTAEEHVDIDELDRAVGLYADLATHLLAMSHSG